MRWFYCEPNSPEAAEKCAVMERIESWWSAFTERRDDLDAVFRGDGDWDLPGWMAENLQTVDSRLMWEFGPGVRNGGHRLVITPEIHHELRPLASAVIAAAPALEGWEFYEYRPPGTVADAQALAEARTGADISVLTVTTELTKPRQINVYYHLTSPDQDSEQFRNAAFVATETLLGEEVLDKWVGIIDVLPPATRQDHIFGFASNQKAAGPGLRLADLPAVVERHLADVQAKLPAQPWWEMIDNVPWTAYELRPQEAADYPGKQDLLTCLSAFPDFHEALFGGRPMYADCFSKFDEQFLFLKIDGSEGLEGSSFGDRSEIEDTLNAALHADACGCVIGGGTGLRYSYVDLAAVDVANTIEVVRRVGVNGGLPARSWIQFYDPSMAGEWVGLTPTTPPPPMPGAGR